MAKFLGWIVLAILAVYPTAYFLGHWSNQSFRDGAIGNWFGTVVGVIVGVPVAVRLARVQQLAQERADREQHQRARGEQFRRITQRLWEELQYNIDAVVQLAEMLQKLPTARAELWDWARQVADSFEFTAWRDFESFALSDSERVAYGMTDIAYRDLRRLANKVRQGAGTHALLAGYSAHDGAANWQMSETLQFARIVYSELSQATKEVGHHT